MYVWGVNEETTHCAWCRHLYSRRMARLPQERWYFFPQSFNPKPKSDIMEKVQKYLLTWETKPTVDFIDFKDIPNNVKLRINAGSYRTFDNCKINETKIMVHTGTDHAPYNSYNMLILRSAWATTYDYSLPDLGSYEKGSVTKYLDDFYRRYRQLYGCEHNLMNYLPTANKLARFCKKNDMPKDTDIYDIPIAGFFFYFIALKDAQHPLYEKLFKSGFDNPYKDIYRYDE